MFSISCSLFRFWRSFLYSTNLFFFQTISRKGKSKFISHNEFTLSRIFFIYIIWKTRQYRYVVTRLDLLLIQLINSHALLSVACRLSCHLCGSHCSLSFPYFLGKHCNTPIRIFCLPSKRRGHPLTAACDHRPMRINNERIVDVASSSFNKAFIHFLVFNPWDTSTVKLCCPFTPVCDVHVSRTRRKFACRATGTRPILSPTSLVGFNMKQRLSSLVIKTTGNIP